MAESRGWADCAHAWRVGLPWASPQFEEKQSRRAQARFRWCASRCRDASAWCLHGRLMRTLFGSERGVSFAETAPDANELLHSPQTPRALG